MSEHVAIGHPVVWVNSPLPRCIAHPIDYYWMKYADEPRIAHYFSQKYIQRRINKMARDAVSKLERMREEFDRKS